MNDTPDGGDEADERLADAYLHSLIPVAKVSGGHAMGYDDDVLCGNIVCNRIALDSAEKCVAALRSLRADGSLPPATADTLVADAERMRAAIADRIAELRNKVWW